MTSQQQPFVVRQHNVHYEGEYSERELEWRRLGAVDKSRNLSTLLAGRPVKSVLEVGCGTGAVLTAVARQGIGSLHCGVDMADPASHRDAEASGLDLSAYDGVTLPFADRRFDLVFASHVVEHVPDPRGLLREIRRVAKQYIYLEVPCELQLRTTRHSLQRTLDIGHINSYTPDSFLLLVQTAGLRVNASQLFDHSLAVHAFHSSATKARVKQLFRGLLLRSSPIWAARMFTYHFGVLCAAGDETT